MDHDRDDPAGTNPLHEEPCRRLVDAALHDRARDRRLLLAGTLLSPEFDTRVRRVPGPELADFNDNDVQEALLQSAKEASARAAEEEEEALAEALALSLTGTAKITRGASADFEQEEMTKALAESLKSGPPRLDPADDPVVMEAALRASRMDLGPRGVSQPAKIISTGDPSLGQPDLVLGSTFNGKTEGARKARRNTGTASSVGATKTRNSTTALPRIADHGNAARTVRPKSRGAKR